MSHHSYHKSSRQLPIAIEHSGQQGVFIPVAAAAVSTPLQNTNTPPDYRNHHADCRCSGDFECVGEGPLKRRRVDGPGAGSGDRPDLAQMALDSMCSLNRELQEQIAYLRTQLQLLRAENLEQDASMKVLKSQLRAEEDKTHQLESKLRDAYGHESSSQVDALKKSAFGTPAFKHAWTHLAPSLVQHLRVDPKYRTFDSLSAIFIPFKSAAELLKYDASFDHVSILSRINNAQTTFTCLDRLLLGEQPLLEPIRNYLAHAPCGHANFNRELIQLSLTAMSITRPSLIPEPLFKLATANSDLTADDHLRIRSILKKLIPEAEDAAAWTAATFKSLGTIVGVIEIEAFMVAFSMNFEKERVYLYTNTVTHGRAENLSHTILGIAGVTPEGIRSFDINTRELMYRISRFPSLLYLTSTFASRQSPISADTFQFPMRYLEQIPKAEMNPSLSGLLTVRLCHTLCFPSLEGGGAQDETGYRGASQSHLDLALEVDDAVEIWDRLARSTVSGLVDHVVAYGKVIEHVKGGELTVRVIQ
ncbi:hypothetical protein BCR39DRAFT_552566 [Naematelia encephala]|uniref:Uncharacterized protein n=1 Tax=Naematelia encephala TaxID=71784 RepID=A0A1Y2AHF6_9TREE|nr:hypothetical protein BCR39DRAFT_552566 [Naematelia encephala]